jgi:uncharacterized protein
MEALPAVWILVATLLVAGFVKGTAGVGLPMMTLGILTFFTDPRTAFAVTLIPIFVANTLQMYRVGGVREAIPRYLPYILCMFVMVPLTLALTANTSERVLLGVLGTVILLYVILNATKWAPEIPDGWDPAAQVLFGTSSGILGGLAGIWLPPMLIYLGARGVDKEEFVRATGVLLFTGSIPLFFGYIREGFLTGPLALISVGLLIPTTVGLLIGERVRRRLSEDTFRRLVMVLFALIAVNMLRRAAFG